MKIPHDAGKRMDSAFQLLTGAEISVSAFESVRTLIKGLHPGLDEKLEKCAKALDMLQKIQQMDVISLSAEHLPETSEKQKKRKKALLFFIETVKDLKSEIKRTQTELQKSQGSHANQMGSLGRIIKFAKGPFGLVTLAAVIIVVATQFFGHKTSSTQQIMPIATPSISTSMVSVIMYQGKELPLSGLYIGHGADCDAPHYHAINGQVIALDGTTVVDPEGCGFGKVANTQVTTVSK